MSSYSRQKLIWMIVSNAVMMLGWMHVLMLLLLFFWNATPNNNNNDDPCQNDIIKQPLRLALMISFWEVGNAILGITRSQPHQVTLFAMIRAGVEYIVSPMLFCHHPAHILTILCWSLGDSIRFFCFLSDAIIGERMKWPKTIRYTVGPILFPIGTLGEMWMVIAAANQRPSQAVRYAMYAAASLWPAGFYPLYKQLLKQRRKYFMTTREEMKKKT